ncbi:bifunctional riboflavin kinase/FAD synthetase [Neisseriaceae bacterium PsAf]|nr:bifunctional riboflavin kinase/FAD synthetase [Neisseriaceae bacterium PsAf]MCV2502655.1 bifunctional riboflavin kinase/FAD synthetase [Neisseriaceae bacterium]
MQTYFGLNHPSLSLDACALTIGNFDGVHKGHLHILSCLKKEAETRNLPTVLITFEPLAKEYFAKNCKGLHPVRISPLQDKLTLIEVTKHIDITIVVNFNQDFSCMSAQTFVQDLLIKQLNTKYLLVGDDFKFGKDRQGNYSYLLNFPDFETQKTPSVMVGNTRVSSSVIRQALIEGNFKQAELFLEHDYFLSGKVKQGLRLGHQLGCPTANIDLNHHYFPLSGVYVVEVKGKFGQKRGVASFGTNPTISDDPSPKFEVHIFDFDENIYEEILTVIFKEKIRDELKFDDLTELKNQIKKDMDFAKNWVCDR